MPIRAVPQGAAGSPKPTPWPSPNSISMEALVRTLEAGMDKVRALLDHLVPLVPPPGHAR